MLDDGKIQVLKRHLPDEFLYLFYQQVKNMYPKLSHSGIRLTKSHWENHENIVELFSKLEWDEKGEIFVGFLMAASEAQEAQMVSYADIAFFLENCVEKERKDTFVLACFYCFSAYELLLLRAELSKLIFLRETQVFFQSVQNGVSNILENIREARRDYLQNVGVLRCFDIWQFKLDPEVESYRQTLIKPLVHSMKENLSEPFLDKTIKGFSIFREKNNRQSFSQMEGLFEDANKVPSFLKIQSSCFFSLYQQVFPEKFSEEPSFENFILGVVVDLFLSFLKWIFQKEALSQSFLDQSFFDPISHWVKFLKGSMVLTSHLEMNKILKHQDRLIAFFRSFSNPGFYLGIWDLEQSVVALKRQKDIFLITLSQRVFKQEKKQIFFNKMQIEFFHCFFQKRKNFIPKELPVSIVEDQTGMFFFLLEQGDDAVLVVYGNELARQAYLNRFEQNILLSWSRTNNKGNTLMQTAFCSSYSPEVFNTFWALGASLTLPSPKDSLFHVAVRLGNLSAVAWLCERNAPISIKDEKNRTAVLLAAERGQFSIVSIFLEFIRQQGLEKMLNEKNLEGFTVFQILLDAYFLDCKNKGTLFTLLETLVHTECDMGMRDIQKQKIAQLPKEDRIIKLLENVVVRQSRGRALSKFRNLTVGRSTENLGMQQQKSEKIHLAFTP